MRRIIALAAFAAFLTVTLAPASSPEARCFLGMGRHCHHHHSILDGLKHSGHSISKGVKHAAKQTAKGVAHAAKATGKWTKQATKDTGNWTKQAAIDTAEWAPTAALDFSKNPACARMARCIARKAIGPLQTMGMCGARKLLCMKAYVIAKDLRREL